MGSTRNLFLQIQLSRTNNELARCVVFLTLNQRPKTHNSIPGYLVSALSHSVYLTPSPPDILDFLVSHSDTREELALTYDHNEAFRTTFGNGTTLVISKFTPQHQSVHGRSNQQLAQDVFSLTLRSAFSWLEIESHILDATMTESLTRLEQVTLVGRILP